MDDKQAARAEQVRRQAGIPSHVPIWVGRQGWAAYAHGIMTVKMQLTPQVIIPIQDITLIDFRPAGVLTQGYIRFNRATDKYGDRQDIIFGSQDESIFLDLKRTIEQDKSRGVKGQWPSARQASTSPATAQRAPSAGDPDEKFRSKYRIPAETLLARAKGQGYVSFDGHFVTIQQVGIGRVVVGKGVKRIPITAISSVQVKSPGWVVAGFIQFSIAGGNEKSSRFGSQSWTAAEDENSMMIGYGEEPAFLALRDAVEAAQRALHQPPVLLPHPVTDDVFAQLEKLGRLRDTGVIRPDEFEAKKAELLDRM